MEIQKIVSESELVQVGISRSPEILQTLAGREDDPATVGYAQFGVGWWTAACQTSDGLADVSRYRELVTEPQCSAWMDNTTLVTAQTLMSPAGPDAMTPLTVWDLATFVRAAVCYDHVYHHEHPDIDDERINGILGAQFLVPIALPIRAVAPGRILPDPWNGAHRLICDIWSDAELWLKRLNEAIGNDTLYGTQVRTVTAAWKNALQRDDLRPDELVDFKELDRRWRSPSNQLLVDTANVTGVDETCMYLDPTEGFEALFRRKRELGLPDESSTRRSHLLTELNLRGYINQRLAEFFALPYACAAGRVPFRSHLYDRALKIQNELTLANVIDGRYREIASAARLQLPVFLSLALRDSERPESLWVALASLRQKAIAFRAHRASLDHELARGNLKEARAIGKALHTSVDDLLAVAGKAAVGATVAILEDISKGDVSAVGTGISAAVAAGKSVLKSSFTDRLLWRLRRPHLLWVNNTIDQAERLTESMPDFARVWGIPPNRQGIFVDRFRRMAALAN